MIPVYLVGSMAELQLNGVQVLFPGKQQQVIKVVRDVSFAITSGQTIGIVGESGSGKSMTAAAILGLIPYPGRVTGSILYENKQMVGLAESAYEKIRGKTISIVFQDPSSSLDPVFTIEQQLLETILAHQKMEPNQAKEAALDALRMVEIPSPAKRIKNYPHQFSGGMKQRILIAMALACDPDVLILDEPTTALDVTVQAQLLDLIERIQKKNHMAIILISHDLGIVAEVADDIAIMYAGRIIESGPLHRILASPKHPYTKGLLNSIPQIGQAKEPLSAIKGFPPDPAHLPSGCPFHPRCDYQSQQCQKTDPPYTKNEQVYACWHPLANHE